MVLHSRESRSSPIFNPGFMQVRPGFFFNSDSITLSCLKYFKPTSMRKMLLAILFVIGFPAFLSAQIDTTAVVYSWKLDGYYANRIRVEVDTTLANFQCHNPAFKKYTGIATLGNYGLPVQSIVYTERPQYQEFVVINNFFPFMKHYDNTAYINTRKPFTRLTYIKGGSSQNKEEILDAFHTQNLTKKLNIGLHYTTVGSLGQYQFQKVKNNSFNFFSSYSGNVYNNHLSVNYNKIIADENGGVRNDSLITDTTYAFTKDIPTLFSGTDNASRHNPDVFNEIRNLNILAVQEIAFRGKQQASDSTGKSRKLRIFYPKLVYIVSLDRTSRLFKDSDPAVGLASGLYPALNVSDSVTLDSLLYWKLFNAARLQFQGRRNNHYFVDYSYEMMNYNMAVNTGKTKADTLEQTWFITDIIKLPNLEYKSRLFNSYVSSGFTRIFANMLELNLYGRYYLSGHRQNDFLFTGDLKLSLGKPELPMTFKLRADNELRSPDFLYTHYASNNFIWTKNFHKTALNHLSTNLTVSSKKFDVQGDYYLLRNVIYLDNSAVPKQYRTALSLLVLSASKRFDFWKITSISKLVYQKSENENVLDLPEITLYNSTYLTHLVNFRATGGKLLTMLGFDFFYNTKYYANAYMPSLASFYRQNIKQLGNYPYFDVFLNVQLKRLRFFLKVEHVNAGWINKNYFSVLHYPRNGRDLKFGLSWTFYD